MRRSLLIAACALAGADATHADGDLTPPQSVREHCASATDHCRVCRIDPADGSIVGCSFPGIACTPEPWRCNEPASVPAPQPEGEREKRL
jgi:hypothetical protein